MDTSAPAARPAEQLMNLEDDWLTADSIRKYSMFQWVFLPLEFPNKPGTWGPMLPAEAAVQPASRPSGPASRSGEQQQKGTGPSQKPKPKAEAAKPAKLQQWSKIPGKQHKWYLALHSSPERMNKLSFNERRSLDETWEKACQEQEAYRAVRAQQGQADVKRYAFCDPAAAKIIEDCLTEKRKRARAYPRFWQACQSLELDPAMMGASNATSSLDHVAEVTVSPPPDPLAAQVQPDPLFEPPAAGGDISLGYNWLASVPQGGKPPGPKALSTDNTSVHLARQHGAHALVAASALQALAQLLPQGLDWAFEIPVRVLAPKGDGKSPQHNLVVLDKPLLRRTMTMRDKYALLHKHALLRMGANDAPAAESSPPAATAPPALADHESILESELEACLDNDDDEAPTSPPRASAAETDAGPASVSAAAAPPPDPPRGQPKRNVRHDLWRLGGLQVVTRSFTTCDREPAEGHNQQPQGVVVRSKTEYMGCTEEDSEEVTPQEQAVWWLAMKLRPGASLVVGRTAVKESQVIRLETHEAPTDTAENAAFFGALVAKLLGLLRQQDVGRYLLSHGSGADNIQCLQALPAREAPPGANVQPLPETVPREPEQGSATLFDLWGGHETAGATDTDKVAYVPQVWKPHDPDVPQIPGTFPVQTHQAPREKQSRKRNRNGPVPTAWNRREAKDWDDVDGDAGRASNATFNEHYKQQLEEI
ncbi:hypothetical protein WJX73_007663 [Symbiochloris irregularis]|uniref:Little elongation complex subunit 2 C-terminal domain-containing protein n=1 Tax=Symbiochloris irregularis TaxID=706552 RepID=A0AAW1P9M5_9CHLO